ncbi:L,D-transpeptidase [Palleronia sp. THAF1]|uniref:L,D-transpeptidase n=1 Tax=Palleronia sp. THAF1 TaxID=2587842 RepID=UPI000F54AE73|nr:L,D-transpeptidase [Palleronia sp. THAF1]
MLTRRHFLLTASAMSLTACASQSPEAAVSRMAPVEPVAPPPPPPMPAMYNAVMTEPFPIPAVPAGVVEPRLWRREVANPHRDYAPGSLVVDPDDAFLYLVQEGGTAMRYGVGVGAAGFDWSGQGVIQYKRKWPRWTPSDEYVARQPKYEPYSIANGGMDAGPDNPLGSRALYIFQDGVDTLYRVHGACEPEYLGKNVSAGCIRMLDQDVIDLFERVSDGVTVTVLPSVKPGRFEGIY